MRIKLLRSLGKNLPEPAESDGDVISTIEKDGPFVEGQVRDCDDKLAHFLVRHLLAEETTEDATKLPMKAAAPKASAPFGPKGSKATTSGESA